MFHIQGKLQGYDALVAKFGHLPRIVEMATASALNKIGRQSVTAAKRSITNTYNIKSSDAASAIKFTGAQKGKRLFAVITARGNRLGLHKFGGLPKIPPNQVGVPVARRKTATVKILKAAPRRPVTRDVSTGHMPFVAGMKSGHIGIFVRTNERLKDIQGEYLAGLPELLNINPIVYKYKPDEKTRGKEKIRELKSRGIAEIFKKTGIAAIDRLLAEKGKSMLEHEFNYYLEREMGKK